MPAHLPGGRPAGSLTHDPKVAVAFGQAVADRRTSLGKSQLKLALESGIERSHMGRIERGENVPNLVAVIKIADALGCSAAELVGECEALLRRGSANKKARVARASASAPAVPTSEDTVLTAPKSNDGTAGLDRAPKAPRRLPG